MRKERESMTNDILKTAKLSLNDMLLEFLEAPDVRSLLHKGRDISGSGLAFRFHNTAETAVSSGSPEFLSNARTFPLKEIQRLYECHPVLDGTVLRGHVFFEESIGRKNSQLLEVLLVALQFILRREVAEERDRRLFISRFFEDLLLEKIPTEQEMRKRAGILGIPAEDDVMIFVLAGLSPDRQDFALGRIKAYFKRAYCVPMGEMLVNIVFPGGIDPAAIRESIGQIADRILLELQNSGSAEELHLHLGAGDPRPSVMYLNESYSEARNAMFFSMVHNKTAPVFWGDTTAFGMICTLAASEEAAALCEYRLGEVFRHDKDNKTNLLETLYAIESCNWNLAQAAKKTLYHYNTLKYRYGKLQKLLNGDLKDNAFRFDLAFALRVKSVRDLLDLYG